MKIAHLILAHKNPTQVERLVSRLNHPSCDCYIHIDKKTAIGPFQYLLTRPGVYLIKNRMACNWGGYSLLEAILGSTREVYQSGQHYDFINLLSGQDYPLKPAEFIYSFFKDRLGYSFISYDNSDDPEWLARAKSRYEKYHLTDYYFRGKYVFQRILNLMTPTRKFPAGFDFYGGNKGTWWTLSNECAGSVISAYENNPGFFNFLKYSWGSDEFAIPTLIMNSAFKNRTINNNHRYIDWSEGNASPKILGIADFDRLEKSAMLFARKFDSDTDTTVLDELDKFLQSNNNSTSLL